MKPSLLEDSGPRHPDVSDAEEVCDIVLYQEPNLVHLLLYHGFKAREVKVLEELHQVSAHRNSSLHQLVVRALLLLLFQVVKRPLELRALIYQVVLYLIPF